MRHLHIPGLIALLGAMLGAALGTTLGTTPGTTLVASSTGAHLTDRHPRPTLPVPTTATVTNAQLGRDSVLAVVTHGRIEKLGADGLARSLEVITPDGARHPVYSVPLEESPPDWFRGDFSLADWRPELHTALLKVSLGPDGDLLVSYDVTTGVLREVPAPRRASTVALRPDGAGVLFTTYAAPQGGGRRVGMLGWDGVRTWLPARGDGSAITSVDGSTLVTTDRTSWWVTDLASRTSERVDTRGYCTPHRWADADSVVATCSSGRKGSQLRRVDLDGTSAPLGIRHPMQPPRGGPPILSDDDVRTVQGRDYYESYGGCGGAVLTRQSAAGDVRIVRVPGDTGVLSLIGTRGDDLLLAHFADDCANRGARSVLGLFDPVAKDETRLTVLPRSESWREVLLASEVRSWVW
jgi:hypothetical protein